MKPRIHTCIALIAATFAASPGAADEDDEHHVLDEIVVTATLLERTVEQLAQPTSVVSGDALVRSQSTSIGETLADEPGVSATYFGPVASRPVIRGQYGERVRVLSNGLDSLDASALSEDHAVSLDSLLADRVEIVRGPATLLYGSGAAGGLVNIVDSRIHDKPLPAPFSGAMSIGHDSATGRRSVALKLDIGGDLVSAHFDAFSRDTDDIEIPGFAESSILRAIEEAAGEDHDEGLPGTVENTSSRSSGGAGAFSVTGDWGFAGISISEYDSNYGIPGHHDESDPAAEEEDVRIDLEQHRFDIKGELGFDAFIENIRFRLASNNYTHTELEGTEIGTMFDTTGTDARIEMRHEAVNGFEGAMGIQLKSLDFVAVGDEAFVPPSDTRQLSIFGFEEYAISDALVLQASARIENQQVSAPLLPRYDDTAFGGSLGAIWSVSGDTTLSANLSLTERHPNSTELYADGPHVAVQRFERGSVVLGNGMLSKERSTNIDITLRSQVSLFEISITTFFNSIDDYILLRPTPLTVDELQVFEYGQADVDMSGFEAEVLFDIFEGETGHLHARLTSDLVRAEESSGTHLPRIPPLRYGFGLHFTRELFEASIEATHHDSQSRLAPNELPTAGYTIVNAEASVRFAGDALLMYLKGTNLGDEDARRHTSPLKDLIPLPGRSLHFGVRWDF